jgi:mono/diheme cytochrome c family protein
MKTLMASLAMALATSAASAQDDRLAEGRAIAERWCASCHVATPDQPTAPDTAPSFLTLAADPAMTPERLAGWIVAPHPPMPDPGLSRDQIAAVTVWIESLKPE